MRHVFGGRAALALALLSLVPLAACGDESDDPDSASPTTTAAGAATRAITGKAHVTGVISLMVAGAAAFDPISTPFTITVPDAGRGGLDLPKAIVNGTEKAIVWNGGRPLPVTGECMLDAGEAAMTLDSGGAHIALDGGVRELTAGACAFGSSVAVGAAGLSSPVDSVRFTLPRVSDFTTTGGAAVTVPAARRYEGRKGGVELTGPRHVQTENDEFNASFLNLTTGTWVVMVTSSGNPAVLRVVADLEGNMTATRA